MASLKFLSRYSLCFSICTDCFSSGNTAGQAVRCGIRRALLRGGGHGTAGHPLLAGTDRHCAALLVLDRRALLGVDWGLLVGVNIGGVGTLVASLASLITFREYTKHVKGQTGRFMALFSVISFGFLPA